MANGKVGIDTARCIREDRASAAREMGGSHSVHHVLSAEALVKMHPAAKHQHVMTADDNRTGKIAMTSDPRLWESRHGGQLHISDDLAQIVGGCGPTGSQNDHNLVVLNSETLMQHIGRLTSARKRLLDSITL